MAIAFLRGLNYNITERVRALNYNFKKTTELIKAVNLDVTHIYHCTVGREWKFDRHSADFNRMYFILDGKGLIYNENERVEFTPNNIYIIPSGGCYNYRCEEYMEKLFVHFTLSVIPHRDLMANIKKVSVFPVSAEDMKKIKDMLYSDSIGSALWFQTYMCNLIYKALAPFDEEVKKDFRLFTRYGEIYRYIESNLYADTTVKDICRHIGFSQTYIGQKFKADTGQTIKEYIMECLTERIKYLLQYTQMSIKDISDMLHFGGEFYCSKFFKKRVGISPSEYRKKHGEILKQ